MPKFANHLCEHGPPLGWPLRSKLRAVIFEKASPLGGLGSHFSDVTAEKFFKDFGDFGNQAKEYSIQRGGTGYRCRWPLPKILQQGLCASRNLTPEIRGLKLSPGACSDRQTKIGTQ